MHTWYMYLDRCVYTYIYMHFFMLICSSVCSYYMIYKHIYTYINIYIKIHIHEHIYIYKQIYKQIYVYTLPYSCFLASFEVLSNKTLVKLWDLFFYISPNAVQYPKGVTGSLQETPSSLVHTFVKTVLSTKMHPLFLLNAPIFLYNCNAVLS